MLGEQAYVQKATYWGKGSGVDRYGNKSYDSPVVLDVRWEDRNESYTGPDGRAVVSRSVVFVKQDLDIGGYLFLGESIAAGPSRVEGALQIQQFVKIPALWGDLSERRAIL